jgi:hypothetical protein
VLALDERSEACEIAVRALLVAPASRTPARGPERRAREELERCGLTPAQGDYPRRSAAMLYGAAELRPRRVFPPRCAGRPDAGFGLPDQLSRWSRRTCAAALGEELAAAILLLVGVRVGAASRSGRRGLPTPSPRGGRCRAPRHRRGSGLRPPRPARRLAAARSGGGARRPAEVPSQRRAGRRRGAPARGAPLRERVRRLHAGRPGVRDRGGGRRRGCPGAPADAVGNVLANPGFGAVVSERGSGTTWSRNSRSTASRRGRTT